VNGPVWPDDVKFGSDAGVTVNAPAGAGAGVGVGSGAGAAGAAPALPPQPLAAQRSASAANGARTRESTPQR
jgi:hypothetical protein